MLPRTKNKVIFAKEIFNKRLRSDVVYGNLIAKPCWLVPGATAGAPGAGASDPPIIGSQIGGPLCSISRLIISSHSFAAPGGSGAPMGPTGGLGGDGGMGTLIGP